MEPARAISPVTSKIREEEESSDSDSEFYDAVSIIDELKNQPNHSTGRTNMTKTSKPDPHKDIINDSGFNEEGGLFEPTSAKLEHIMTTGVGENRISLEEDTEEDGTPLSEGGSKTRSINKDDHSSSDEEDGSNSFSEKEGESVLSYWDPRDNRYKNKKYKQGRFFR